LTPVEFSLLCDRHKVHLERLDYHTALICAVVANCFRDSKKKAFQPEDFMPKARKKQNPEEILNLVKNYQAMFEVKDGE
jgi:hypothetical protein